MKPQETRHGDRVLGNDVTSSTGVGPTGQPNLRKFYVSRETPEILVNEWKKRKGDLIVFVPQLQENVDMSGLK